MSGHSGEPPAKDMPAVAAFTSMEQVRQEQERQGQQPEQQQQQQQALAAAPTGTLQDMDTNDLVSKRNQILYEQAVKGQQPGLTLMQDKLGDNLQETWGNEPTIMEPDQQN
uniref:Uncharacterized protein n=1 Tax=Tetradesmus obliquus TaxID=3088 RepID=A0A383V823_TETOB|eukprot:jgi/Sobl393_1/8707/SZX60922.1